MARVQLALNVSDLDASIEFYSKMFGVPPAKVRDGYANFAFVDPPEVMAADARARGAELSTEVQESTTCCFAVQDMVWVQVRTTRGSSTPCWRTSRW